MIDPLAERPPAERPPAERPNRSGEPQAPSDRASAQHEGAGERTLQQAVGWLLGPELIANLRSILRRKGRRGDPRTWMAPNRHKAHDEYRDRDGRLRPVTPAAPAAVQPSADDRDVWFDYIADLGDSTDATYATAFACQADLQLELAPGEELPTCQAGCARRAIHVQGVCKGDAGRGNLPRGQFLFVGGDTAYHVADEVTVLDRVARPFNWATRDLAERTWHDGTRPLLPVPRTRLYGMPGNHDWYNDLHGFSLLFLGPRESAPASDPQPTGTRPGGLMAREEPAIDLEGFEPQQQASYVAIQLPYGWQLWGLDIDQGIDARQAAYFRSLLPGPDADAPRDPARLILCTPSPPVAFHTAIPCEEHSEAIAVLSLTPAYQCRPAGPADPSACSLPTGACRLDLSGDIHHYARYRWLEHGPDGTTARYMAVVSGLGGAFHHPSFTRAGGLPPVAVYPTQGQSLASVAPKLLHWRSLISGSWIRAFPVVFGLVLAFGSINHGGAGWVLSRALSAIPGLRVEPCGASDRLWESLLMLGTFVAAAGLLWLAISLFERSYGQRLQLAKEEQPPRLGRRARLAAWARTSYAWCTIAAIAGLAMVFLFHLCRYAPPASTSLLDIGVAIVLLAGTAGGFLLAAAYGAKHLPWWRKLSLGGLGLVHGIAQIGTPLVFARLLRLNWMVPIVWAMFAVWWFAVRDPTWLRKRTALAIGAAALGIALAAQGILHPPSSTPIVAGLVIVATWLLLLPSRWLFRKQLGYMVLLDVVWFVAWGGGIAALLWAAQGVPAPDPSTSPPLSEAPLALYHLLQFTAGSIMAAPLGLAYFAWYLAISGLADAHNNEVGGAARVTLFRQIIRFHLHSKGLTGYVISVENGPRAKTKPCAAQPAGDELPPETPSPARTQGTHLRFWLQDVFTIADDAQTPNPGSAPPG